LKSAFHNNQGLIILLISDSATESHKICYFSFTTSDYKRSGTTKLRTLVA